MKIEEFILELDEFLDELKSSKSSFEQNMKHLNHTEDSFCNWIMTFLAWSELGDLEDCRNFYGNED